MNRTYLGLDLSGAKNQKTTLAVLQYYPKEAKTFLLDLHSGIGGEGDHSSDQVLLEILDEILGDAGRGGKIRMGVNVPMTLPPCFGCDGNRCRKKKACSSPDSVWATDLLKRLRAKSRGFTAYTQRPVEIWLRHVFLPGLPQRLRFEIDETMGGNRAPLTARMMFLGKVLRSVSISETLPKLSAAVLGEKAGLPVRMLENLRDLDEGASAREELLTAIAKKFDIFVYDRDFRRISQNLSCFDAFFSALTVVLADRGACEKPPRHFPVSSGWIEVPR
jgi:hypothetical protein